ncbi:hypothetical protein D3C73_628910 [compost metagenome]
MSWDKDLQIIQAEVKLSIDHTILVEEPLCIDVGLPALLLSALEDVKPNRWAQAHEWERMPFFVCGCGDPECRAFSFVVHHGKETELELIEVEEKQNSEYRVLDTHLVNKQQYRIQVMKLGWQYIQFIEGLDYKPYMANTVEVVKELLEKLEQEGSTVR